MSKLITDKLRHAARPKVEDACSIVVAYEDTPTRDRAMLVCDHLVGEFWPDVAFQFSWWKFDFVGDTILGAEASRAAAHADMLMFSAHARSELPPAVRNWIDTWVHARKQGPGILVALVGMADDGKKGMTPAHVFLKNVARRARMDFLPLVLQPVEDTSSKSVDVMLRRANEVSPVLSEILDRRPPPPRWGINE